jgi:hypothetical protein
MSSREEKKKKNEKPVSKGLCDNCINLKYCSYAKVADRPVMFCEEYDFYSRLVEKYGIDVNGEEEDNEENKKKKDQKKGSPK